ncbi:hypothetical protein [Bremerella sp. P1]|uniref:hypothetical protein n=1 Tax=Bremerella sp. P1 TaxID=3026424 RepID=UPI002368E175|nr:hypothetical protein [Bremerella sp. P1]WDI43258.1 hypothetical protein PSR63_04775 [Bremerella sp. P1]
MKPEHQLLMLGICSVPLIAVFHVYFLRAGIRLFNKLFVKVPKEVKQQGMEQYYCDNGAVREQSFFTTYLFMVGAYVVVNLFWLFAGPWFASYVDLDLQNKFHGFLLVVISLVGNTILMAIMLLPFLATTITRALIIAIFQTVIGAVIVGLLTGIGYAVYYATNAA